MENIYTKNWNHSKYVCRRKSMHIKNKQKSSGVANQKIVTATNIKIQNILIFFYICN